jgi:hypothetical protein
MTSGSEQVRRTIRRLAVASIVLVCLTGIIAYLGCNTAPTETQGYKKSYRPNGYGMTAELNRKKNSKFDVDLADDALTWIAEVLKSADLNDEAGKIRTVKQQEDVVAPLRSGVLLCKLINIIKPGSVKKINHSRMSFKQMENIGKFLSAAENIGVKKADLFQTVDLFERQNVPQVVNGIVAVGRKSSNIFDGPSLGR